MRGQAVRVTQLAETLDDRLQPAGGGRGTISWGGFPSGMRSQPWRRPVKGSPALCLVSPGHDANPPALEWYRGPRVLGRASASGPWTAMRPRPVVRAWTARPASVRPGRSTPAASVRFPADGSRRVQRVDTEHPVRKIGACGLQASRPRARRASGPAWRAGFGPYYVGPVPEPGGSRGRPRQGPHAGLA